MVEIAEVRTSPPSNGLPGLSIFSSGQWAMTAAGGGYVLTASNTATGASGDTLYISASQVVVRHPASLSDAGAERVYVR